MDRLNIIATDETPNGPKRSNPTKASKRTKAQATFERLWLTEPEIFNPLLTCMGRARVERTWELIAEYAAKEAIAADLGTGLGVFSLRLSDHAVKVHAVDIAAAALEHLRSKGRDNIELFQDYVPHTTLESDFYDLVLGLDLIAYLPKADYRLFFAEMSRLIKPEGLCVVSTPIDIYSEDALQEFADLADSEFVIDHWIFSHHSYYIRLLSVFEAPAIYAKAGRDKVFYAKELNKRFSINRSWFKFNSSKAVSFIWRIVKIFTNPIEKWLKQSNFVMLNLEKICRFISDESGISHAILMGKRRKLFEDEVLKDHSVERKGKHQIWE